MRSPQEVQELMDSGTSFMAQLFRLMDKADSTNFKLLSRAYPAEGREYIHWLHDGRQITREEG